MQKPIVFFGSSAYVLPILEELKKHFLVALVITTEKNTTDAVPNFCIKNTIDYISVSSLNNTVEQKLQSINTPIGILADFGIIVSKKIIDIFPYGIINIHPSLLPKYRGATPVQTAILDGQNETGVSIMLLEEKLDAGPILYQQKEAIANTDTAKILYEKLFTLGAHKLPEIINDYLLGKLTIKKQDDSIATYTKTLNKESGFIDSTAPSTQKNLDNMIRAFYPWPGVWAKMQLYGKEKIVKLLPSRHPELDSGSILLQVEGKNPMTVKDFINGYPEAKQILQKLGLL